MYLLLGNCMKTNVSTKQKWKYQKNQTKEKWSEATEKNGRSDITTILFHWKIKTIEIT